MKIRATIKYPPPAFKARDLTFSEACKLVDALTKELAVTNRHIVNLETVLERCQTYFVQRLQGEASGQDIALHAMIEEVLK